MSKTGDHAEDIEHELEHAGREVADRFLDSVDETNDPEELAAMSDGDNA